jgi:ESS family glutamate:Na+ symporter
MIELLADGVVAVRPFLSVTVAILALFAGKAINRRVRPLREYNIPEPVTGGLLFAVGLGVVYAVSGLKVDFEMTARDVLLVYFFTTIGINARISDLRSGGRPLVILLGVTVATMVLQNVVGLALATLLGYPAATGLLTGSVAMTGGHGTAIAWAPAFASQHGIARALEIGLVCATGGLLLGSIAGGPVARYLILRHRLEGPAGEAPDVGVRDDESRPQIDYHSFLGAILAIHASAIIGIFAKRALDGVGLNLPFFVPCLLAGILLTNLLPRVAPRLPWPARTTALALIGEVSLGIFLAMSIMSMQLWTLGALAAPVALLLAAQLATIVLVAVLVAFRLLGRGYDAAVMSAGFIGFGLGATPTAMANMTAVTQRHGASHVAFLVVPLVGAFFIDLVNAFVIRAFLALFITARAR